MSGLSWAEHGILTPGGGIAVRKRQIQLRKIARKLWGNGRKFGGKVAVP